MTDVTKLEPPAWFNVRAVISDELDREMRELVDEPREVGLRLEPLARRAYEMRDKVEDAIGNAPDALLEALLDYTPYGIIDEQLHWLAGWIMAALGDPVGTDPPGRYTPDWYSSPRTLRAANGEAS